MNTGKGLVSVAVTVMVSWVAREGEASLKLESVARVVLLAPGMKRAGVAALEGLEPAASTVAGTIVVRVITL
jgi:uncharacterized membrane protein (DUF441 family)